MIEIKPARNVPGFRFCPVCSTRLAPKGSNARVTIDAESEATAIATVAHEACAQDVVEFARIHGYAPERWAEVGARISEEES